jgi:ElaB/YqjD/DUF883 family membrane-anchored ribosome-binding protein
MSNTGSTRSTASGQRSSTNRGTGNSSFANQVSDTADDIVGQGKDAGSDLTSLAQGATDELKRSAALLARDGSEKLADALSKQLSAGAGFFEEASESLRAAAAELDETLPPVAYALRTAARNGDEIAEQIRTKTLGELLDAGSVYARQNPLVVFGAAAGVGLLISRFAKSTRQMSSPPNSSGQGFQPTQGRGGPAQARTRTAQSTSRPQGTAL